MYSSLELSALHDHTSYLGLNHTTLHVLRQTCRSNCHRSNYWAKPRGSKNPNVSKVVSVPIILTTLSLSTPQVCVNVSRSDSVVSAAALRCTGLQMNRDSPAGKGTRFLSSLDPPNKVISPPVSQPMGTGGFFP